MGKVLQFPSNYKPENPPEIDTSAAETRENFAWCEQLAEGLTYGILSNLQKNGVNLIVILNGVISTNEKKNQEMKS